MFFAYDIATDFSSGRESLLHIVLELLVFAAISTVLFSELRRIARLRHEIRAERSKTARLSGALLRIMRAQFAAWGLSPSESEVALLLIKGLSMREISKARQVQEKTVRQQATAIYAKSGYGGRHELAAHFIEDLMGGSVLSGDAADEAGVLQYR
ncbi:MAG TPA: LuxR C-terminal-related transcriptional regulator [Woeseiaceae bacterium]|nr:LuxR C-terminal-related transcriptional regulator [Woeseiaceae bacterium]